MRLPIPFGRKGLIAAAAIAAAVVFWRVRARRQEAADRSGTRTSRAPSRRASPPVAPPPRGASRAKPRRVTSQPGPLRAGSAP